MTTPLRGAPSCLPMPAMEEVRNGMIVIQTSEGEAE